MILNLHQEVLLLCSSALLQTTCAWLGEPPASSEVRRDP